MPKVQITRGWTGARPERHAGPGNRHVHDHDADRGGRAGHSRRSRSHFELGDTRLPQAPVSGGSQTSASVGSAVKAGGAGGAHKGDSTRHRETPPRPCTDRAKIKSTCEDGRLFLKNAPTQGETYADLLKRNNMDMLEAESERETGRREKAVFHARVRGAVRRSARQSRIRAKPAWPAWWARSPQAAS